MTKSTTASVLHMPTQNGLPALWLMYATPALRHPRRKNVVGMGGTVGQEPDAL